MNTERLSRIFLRARNGLAYIMRGDLRGFTARWRTLRRERQVSANLALPAETILPGTLLRWCVMATPHTRFIAHLIAKRLQQHGWSVTITLKEPDTFDAHFYVVVCPQMFKNLPPPERRFLYQMEQSVSSRWFTPDYLDALRNSRGMLDYALTNFEFLEKHEIAYPHTYYLPVGADPSYASDLHAQDKRYDVLFYGDAASSPRRRKLLETLQQHFSVHCCSEVFGDEMRQELLRARVVINLHYYENALLEMPRIQECISLGVPVVSESSQDQDDYPEIVGAVRFFPAGDETAMIKAIGDALSDPVSPEQIRIAAERGWERFCFMFDRFLAATKMLHPAHLLNDPLPVPGDATRIVLSLPETMRRRRSYEAHRLENSATFDGVRYSPGWIGCGLSYAAMARHALRNQVEPLLLVEDDAQLPDDFEQKIDIIRAYLQANKGHWDIFAGLIADLHADTRVIKVETFQGLCFVTIDKMTSMVCNVYSRRGLELLAAWNPAEGTEHNNTIDRYLENSQQLRVVVVLPFLASLRGELESTLWGIGNQRYLDVIAESQAKLEQKVQAYLKNQPDPHAETPA